MNGKTEVRIQTSILNKMEKRILVAMANRMPSWITSDNLTVVGVIGALTTGVGYILSSWNLNFLWLASFGLILNWFGDSLDGTLARVRNAQRPIYGFYIDHNIDGLTITIMCIGAGLSPMIKFSTAMLILVGYLLLSIFTYINAYLKGEFRISYGNLGPTEFRLIVIIINTMFIYFPFKDMYLHIMKYEVGVYDAIGFGIAILLFLIFLISFFVFLRKYKQVDPPHSFYNHRGKN